LVDEIAVDSVDPLPKGFFFATVSGEIWTFSGTRKSLISGFSMLPWSGQSYVSKVGGILRSSHGEFQQNGA